MKQCDNSYNHLCDIDPCTRTYYITSIACFLYNNVDLYTLSILAASLTMLGDTLGVMINQYDVCYQEDNDE